MKRYLGDGVYADWEGFDLVLTTENGIATTNRIVLDTDVQERLAIVTKDQLAQWKADAAARAASKRS